MGDLSLPTMEGEENLFLCRDIVVREDLVSDLGGCENMVSEEGDQARLSWEESCLQKFTQCMGLLIEGFEDDFLKLMTMVSQRRNKGKRKGTIGSTKFDRELKKLEWTVKERDD